jgi:hypothetical protein
LCQLSQRRTHGIKVQLSLFKQLPEQFLRVWRRIPAKFYEARSISEISLFIRPKLTVKFKLIVSFTDVCLPNPAPVFCATRQLPKLRRVPLKTRRTLATAGIQGKAQMWYLWRPFLAV